MTQRPQGLDALLNYVAENLDVNCEHRGGSYFCTQTYGVIRSRGDEQ